MSTSYFRLRTSVVIALFAVLWAMPMWGADRYTGFELSADEQHLTLFQGKRHVAAPQTETDQAGFSAVKISADGRMVGWLVLEPNCCTSYAIPLGLVIVRHGKVLRQFSAIPPVWDWAFAQHGRAVVYRQRTLHGSSSVLYTLARLSDGHTLTRYSCFSEGPQPDPRKVPAWVWPIADECPERAPQ